MKLCTKTSWGPLCVWCICVLNCCVTIIFLLRRSEFVPYTVVILMVQWVSGGVLVGV